MQHTSSDYDDEKAPTANPNVVEDQEERRNPLRRFMDSFKPADISHIDTTGMTKQEVAAVRTAHTPLQRSLKSRHLQMIAIGGSIGTGLFVGSGKSLAIGGPASLIICFLIIGSMLYCTVLSLGELAVTYSSTSGSFLSFAHRLLEESWSFAFGWNYILMWMVILPTELVAASISISGYWETDVPDAAFVAIFWVAIAIANVFGVRGYGEIEFVLSLIKVLAVVGFIIFGIIANCGGIPGGNGYIGGRFWHDPGAFANGFHGLCGVFVNAAFSFSGTELVGLAAAETQNPRKALPAATKQVFWRLLIFYVVSMTMIGLLVPYTDSRLMGATSSVDATASPFVIAVVNAGVKVLPSIINAVILAAVLSVANSSTFATSRAMCALANMGHAPKILGYIDRQGRPIVGIGITLAFGLLGFLVASGNQDDVFLWFQAIAGICLLFTWFTINACHLRFRRAYHVQGRTTDDLAFKSVVGIYGSAYGLVVNFLVLAVQFYVALYPVGGPYLNAKGFFQAFLAAPIVLTFWIGYWVVKRPKWIRSRDIDLDTGRREVDLDLLRQEIAEEKAYMDSRGRLYKLYKIFF